MKTKLLIVIIFISISSFAQNKVGKKFHHNIPKGYVYIPPGSIKMNDEVKNVQAFYISQTEVSNGEYQEFLDDLKVNNKTKELNIASIKSGNWNDYEISEAKEYAKEYQQWKEYPVVNISKEAAILYCKWLTEKTRKETGNNNLPKFRLPEKAEWIWAAKGNLENKDYPWSEIKDKKGNYKLQAKVFGNSLGPVRTLQKTPNNFGIYNICGNVAEYIANEDIAMGGSWNQPIEQAKTNSEQKSETSSGIGFRPVVTYYIK